MLYRPLILPMAALSLCGCAADFSSYNEVDKLRVLAIRAEPPDLKFEDETTLDALVVGEVESYAWSWCPFDFSDRFTGECPLAEENFRALVAGTGGQEEPPPYELGSGPSQPFQNLVPPAMLDAFCSQIGMVELPEGFEPPPCDGRFDVSIRLVVEGPEGRVVTTRRLSLIYQEDLVPNQNPNIAGGQLSVRGAPPFPFVDGENTVVARDVEYTIDVEVPQDSVEVYPDVDEDTGQAVERLTITWFYEAGAMDKSRSSYLEGFNDLENLGRNVYRTPTEEEFSGELSKLFFVLRDERGGLNWFTAQLELSL